MNTNEIIKILRSEGDKITKARKAIISLLVRSEKPQNIPDIVERLKKKNISINKTTAYREIYFLLNKGLVEFCTLDSDIKQYKLKDSNNHLAHCIKCNKYVDTCTDFQRALNSLKKSLAEQSHFKIQTQSLHLHGVCKNCQLS